MMDRKYLKGYLHGRLRECEFVYNSIDDVLGGLEESVRREEMTQGAYDLMKLAVMMVEQSYRLQRRASPKRVIDNQS